MKRHCGSRFGRRRALPLAALAIVAATLLLGTRLGTGFMPTMDEGAFVLDYLTPPGTSFDESNRLLMKIEHHSEGNAGSEHVLPPNGNGTRLRHN